MRRKFLTHVLRWMAPWLAGLLLVALVLRHFWRDYYAWTAPAFYALPLPLHVAGWLLLTLIWRNVNRRLAWLCAVGVVCSSVLWWMNTKSLRGESAAAAASPASPDGPRILFWNIGHTDNVPAALHDLITELQPDMIGLAEAENLGVAGFAELREKHAGFQAVQLQDGAACLVRGAFPPPSSRILGLRVAVNFVTATFSRIPGEWRICLTDLPPWPPLPRTDFLDTIRRLAGTGPRTIVAGDFNTPLDSSGFDAWRADFHHGFADCAAWSGPLETWGFGIPILAIDHIWMSRDLAPRAARKAPRLGQDHSWLFVECGRSAP
jgi:hypothetical protein